MFKISVEETNSENGTVLLLVGRNGKAEKFIELYKKHCPFRLIGIEPEKEWYPAPNGVNNQKDSISGLKKSIPYLIQFILELENKFCLDRSKLALVGFSAGAVMAIEIAQIDQFSAVVCHNGAILDLNLRPDVKTPFLVIHSENDHCFSWEERFLPMKNSFLNHNYNVEFIEKSIGGHTIETADIIASTNFLSDKFLYVSCDKNS